MKFVFNKMVTECVRIFFVITFLSGFSFAQDPNKSEGISDVGTLSSVISRIERLPGQPAEFKLFQNYPNPFNNSTKIKYSIAKSGYVEFAIYDITGKQIKKFDYRNQNAGVYEILLQLKNFSSGTYIYELKTEGRKFFKKMNYLK